MYVLLIILIGLSAFAWYKRQEIYDWSKLRNYNPPIQIQQLAFDTTMNNFARKLFYVYHPELNDRTSFNQNCSDFDEHTIVLGCYSSAKGIFLFDIDDQRLDGVEQVTAAHEMLHAAYDRLNNAERSKIDSMTNAMFKNITDDRIKETIASYRKRDAGVVPNELHSILATEVRNLSPELEQYYEKYFSNRQAVVAFSEKYESALTKQRNQATALELQISGLRHEIDKLEAELTIEQENLIKERAQVDSKEKADTFNAKFYAFNHRVDLLNSQIERHNSLLDDYKKVALETQELYQALDSRPKL